MRKGKGSDLHFDGGMREKEKVSKLFLKKQELSSSDDGKRRRTLKKKKKKTSKEQKRNVTNLVKRILLKRRESLPKKFAQIIHCQSSLLVPWMAWQLR